MAESGRYICTLPELRHSGGRKRVKIAGKDIFVVLHEGQVFALDSFCYHAGGPLFQGDIEELPGHACLVCPWHKYKITLQSGEGLYHSIDPYNLKKPPKLCSKGVKQRTHAVTIKGNEVYVTLSDDTLAVESDQYNKVQS